MTAAKSGTMPVHEAGMANTAQRGPAYHNPSIYRAFHHKLGKELFDGLRAEDDLGAVYFNREASANDLGVVPGMGAGRRVDLLGWLNRSPTNEPGASAHHLGLGAGHGRDLRRADPTNDPGADLVGLGVLRPATAKEDPAGGVNYNTEQGALYCNAAGFALLEPGTPVGEALLGTNLAAKLGAPYANAPMSARAPGTPFGEALVGKIIAAELGAPYGNAPMSTRDPGMPLGEALLGKNLAAELGAPYANAPMSTRDPAMPLGEALLDKNCVAELDAPYSNAAVFAHQLGMNAGEALRATPASPYAVQVFIEEAIGAKAGGPIAVGAKAAGADGVDARGRAGKLSAVVGVVAASSAVTAVAAGALSPAVAFGSFLVLLAGLSLAASTVRGA